MAAKTHGDRLDRLEQIVQVIAEDQLSLQKLIAELATETRRGFDRVAEQSAETDKRMRQTDERFRQTDERFRQTDERIDKLVGAIVELIRQRNGSKN
jgi:vacuolar-type H+-ATPase subunit I/STV1